MFCFLPFRLIYVLYAILYDTDNATSLNVGMGVLLNLHVRWLRTWRLVVYGFYLSKNTVIFKFYLFHPWLVCSNNCDHICVWRSGFWYEISLYLATDSLQGLRFYMLCNLIIHFYAYTPFEHRSSKNLKRLY